jgi:hypothetical protein
MQYRIYHNRQICVHYGWVYTYIYKYVHAPKNIIVLCCTSDVSTTLILAMHTAMKKIDQEV